MTVPQHKNITWLLAAWLAVIAGCATNTTFDRSPSRGRRVAPGTSDQHGRDDAPAIQRAMDAAATEHGGRVALTAGRFILRSSLTVPEGVTLAGVWESPHHAVLDRGTVFHVYANHGQTEGTPLILLSPSSAIRGITFFYPRQQVPDVIPYPWTVRGRGMHNSIIDCTFVNAYQAIDLATHHHELHYVRNCFGCPLVAGIRVDQCTDIGRIENVHFNPHYWGRAEAKNAPEPAELHPFLENHLIAFEFGRTDWQYVHNTFCFGAKIGYRFVDGEPVGANGNFLGIGADWCERAIVVEACQKPGLLITNGEFVGGDQAQVMVDVRPSNTEGTVQFNNCSFWGVCPGVARIAGTGLVSFSQCYFQNYKPEDADTFTLMAAGGDLSVQDCRFAIDRPGIDLGQGLATARIIGNQFTGQKLIRNRSHAQVQQGLNTVRRAQPEPSATP